MIFNSLEFIFLYLPITLIGFYLLGSYSKDYAVGFLSLASIVFYATWSPIFTLLLIFSIIVNYTGGLVLCRVHKSNLRKVFFLGFVIFDLGLLFYYKYIEFFLCNFNLVFGTELPVLQVMLPIGISFFTFTQLAFLVDVYKGHAKEYNFVHYILFVTYFPHLVAGPILHHAQMMPQFSNKKTYVFDANNLAIGIFLFIIGLSKKVLLADRLGAIATPLFDSAEKISPEFFTAWEANLAYSLQLYFDFSGYSDMAVALALMMGITLPINFNSPYKAKSIIDFWRRWHISLSQFLLHYLYIPLGGNKHGSLRRHQNLLVTMILGGLWHGASWNFVIWGGLHGFYLIVNHCFRSLPFPVWTQKIKGISFLKWILTFICILIAWVFFRSPSVERALDILKGMFFLHGVNLKPYSEIIFSKIIIISLLIATLMPNSMQLIEKFKNFINGVPQVIDLPNDSVFFGGINRLMMKPYAYALCIYGLGIGLAILAFLNIIRLNSVSYFIYFQF